ncbi:hypothetical protein [Streptomyces iakyrus]
MVPAALIAGVVLIRLARVLWVGPGVVSLVSAYTWVAADSRARP